MNDYSQFGSRKRLDLVNKCVDEYGEEFGELIGRVYRKHIVINTKQTFGSTGKLSATERKIRHIKGMVEKYGVKALIFSVRKLEENVKMGKTVGVKVQPKYIETICIDFSRKESKKEKNLRKTEEIEKKLSEIVVPEPQMRVSDEYSKESCNWQYSCPQCRSIFDRWTVDCPKCNAFLDWMQLDDEKLKNF